VIVERAPLAAGCSKGEKEEKKTVKEGERRSALGSLFQQRGVTRRSEERDVRLSSKTHNLNVLVLQGTILERVRGGGSGRNNRFDKTILFRERPEGGGRGIREGELPSKENKGREG